MPPKNAVQINQLAQRSTPPPPQKKKKTICLAQEIDAGEIGRLAHHAYETESLAGTASPKQHL